MPRSEDFSSEKPKKKPRPPDEDVEEPPQTRRRRPAEEEDDPPPRPKRRRVEDEEEAPAPKARRRRVEEEDEEEERPRRARRRRDEDEDEDDDEGGSAVASIIPYKNPRALAGYYCGVFSLVPGLALILGPIAVTLGILGMMYVSRHPIAKGTGHALTGIILGFLTTIANWGFLIWVMASGGPVGWYGKYYM